VFLYPFRRTVSGEGERCPAANENQKAKGKTHNAKVNLTPAMVSALATVGFSQARYSPLYVTTWPSANRRCETSSLFADTQGGRVGSAKHSLGVIRRKVLGLLIPVKIIAGGTGPIQT